jgi:hypothetical protein
LRRRPASRRVDIGIGVACDRIGGGENIVAIANGTAAAARKRFRNLKCGARIQRGFTYCGSDNFKIICG